VSFLAKGFFEARQLLEPDGRPLHLYACEDAEFTTLSRFLPLRVMSGQVINSTAQWFVLWASERIRRSYAGGMLTWGFVFDGLGLAVDRDTAIKLTEHGLRLWKRRLHLSAGHGHRLFLYSLMAEGGLPDALLSRESGYSAAVLGTIAEIERMGVAGAHDIARRWAALLPGVYRNEETTMFLAELAQAFVGLRAAVPKEITGPAAELWLDAHRPNWTASLPMRLSEEARIAILRPALTERDEGTGAPVAGPQRLLRRRADGRGWAGAIRVQDGMLVPANVLPGAAANLALRLVSEEGKAFRAAPDGSSWRLSVPESVKDLPLDPWQPWGLTAYADGTSLGDAVLSPGLPEPSEAPSLWRRAISDAGPAEELVPAASGKTRGECLWILAGDGQAPIASAEITIGPGELAPGGTLWRVSGRGQIQCGELRFRVETRSEGDEAEAASIIALGRLLEGWQSEGGLQVHLGTPRFLGQQGVGPNFELAGRVRTRQMRRLLGGTIVEWRHEDESVASIALIQLPQSFSIRMRETKPGCAEIEVTGMAKQWLISASTIGVVTATEPEADVRRMTLDAGLSNPAIVTLILSSPSDGRMLRLSAPWPSREPLLIDPDGMRLGANRDISLPRLAGWRGVVAGHRGAIQVRLARNGRPVGFAVQGVQRLSAWSGLLAQSIALEGSDGRVNLRMVDKTETPRLAVGRYDWEPAMVGNVLLGGGDHLSLRAITLDEPFEFRETNGKAHIDFADWLGNAPMLWFVQGQSDRGMMRPISWSPEPRPHTSRQERIAQYQDEFQAMLEDVSHLGWDRLIRLIRLARQAGGCGALDQVQALSRVPSVAIVLLFRMKPEEVALTFDLETEAPFWWPLIPVADWRRALDHVIHFQLELLTQAGIEGAAARSSATASIRRRIGSALLHRPELKAHFGLGLYHAGLEPVAPLAGDGDAPLLVPNPAGPFVSQMNGLVSRTPEIPQGVSGVRATRRWVTHGFDERLSPLIDTPFAVAEVAAGIESAAEPHWILQILALRHADPQWFDAALPLALQRIVQELDEK